MAGLKACFKLFFFLLWCLLLVPPQIIVLAFSRGRASYILPRLWHRLVCATFRLEIVTEGVPVRDRQALYVSNHVSYLDIPVISTVLPVSFVAKEDVADWPLFGLLAKLQQTAFISRARSEVVAGKNNIRARFGNGDSLVIFPEGTSSDGTKVLPFKSSLFSALPDSPESEDFAIQPFTVVLMAAEGKPVTTQGARDLYAWYGEMTLMPHLWALAKSKGAKVKLHFHAPLQVKQTDNRKSLAKICHDTVAGVLEQDLAKAA